MAVTGLEAQTTAARQTAAKNPHLATNIGQAYGAFDPGNIHVIGVLPGEGVGPEVVPVALRLLSLLAAHSKRQFDISEGGPIGYPAIAASGSSLSPQVKQFAGDIFDADGALFCGPGGDRFVYELRKAFDLFCKFTPIKPLPELQAAGAVREATVAGVDIIAVRENMGGIYQGSWSTGTDSQGRRVASHQFEYTEEMVNRILGVALKLAAGRRKRLHLVLKPGGVPSISRLWRECAEAKATAHGVELFEQEVDNTVYQLIANPRQFDVILSPNMFGDVIADCGSLLLASRGLSYSGNFNAKGNAAFQTGHGAARDIAGKDIANPIGQIMSLAMMLRESFGWHEADQLLNEAVKLTLRAGFCTHDVALPGGKILGTQAFGAEVEKTLEMLLAGRII
jgi:3-isopropylmalate dehydrogenase